jgi:hypothetical protein
MHCRADLLLGQMRGRGKGRDMDAPFILASRQRAGAVDDDLALAVLQARLTELRAAGFIELIPASGYRLTEMGRELFQTFLPLHRFAERWSKLQS